MAGVVGETLLQKKLTLSVAESCTGGLIGKSPHQRSGQLRLFSGRSDCLTNQAKMDLLGVSKQTLDTCGAVSDPVVREMAEGVRRELKADLDLPSPHCGPDGGTEQKPVARFTSDLPSGTKPFPSKYRFWGKREQTK